ncbi:hypothetical protein CAEBREN_29789 [Caenorhabditis brenneri]|uniref:Adenylyl cyclase-associated protein n=1 Tax=Caenorhabditis brenneri TaxID=135651 RepID=G0NJR7_CAEBE|nr:hypothetical protein CAEBREN_29789 [Caenorhabditis brenneri]
MDPTLVSRLECVADRMESILLKHDMGNTDVLSAKTPASSENSSAPKVIELLDDSIGEKLMQFQALSERIDGDVGILGKLSKTVFDAHRNFIWTACGRKQPETIVLVELISDLSKAVNAVTEFKETRRDSKYFDNICAFEAGVSALGWVAIPKTPAPFIKEAIDSSLFYTNRILMSHKDEDATNRDWAKLLKNLLNKLHSYVLKNHTTGLIWNSEPGKTPVSALNKGSIPPNSVPLPPPPPPPFSTNLCSSTNNSKGPNVAALLDSLNTGLDATNRLRKVTPEMQTHKNPALRRETAVIDKQKKQLTEAEPSNKHEPRIFWDGKIWKIDFQVGNKNAVVSVKEKKESVYVYKCIDSVIKVDGKANTITLDGCKRTSVVFDGLVSQCEIINSQSIQVQTLGELPTISIQKSDGCHIFLSREALTAQVVASKSSEMTVSAQLGEDDEYTELAIPEQFTTSILDKKLNTVPSDIV